MNKLKNIPTVPYLESYPILETVSQIRILRRYVKIAPTDQEPWLPIQFVGSFPIWCHWNTNSNDFWSLDESAGFKVLLNKADYKALYTKYRDIFSEDPDSSIAAKKRAIKHPESYKDYVINNNLWRIDRNLCNLDESAISEAFDKDEDNKMALEALLDGYNVCPLYGLFASGASDELLPQDFIVNSKMLAFHEDDERIYVLLDQPERAQQIEDQLNCEYEFDIYKRIVPFYAPKTIQERIKDSSDILESESFKGVEDQREQSGRMKIFSCDEYDTRNPSEESILGDPKLALAYILNRAIRAGASDIHIQAQSEDVKIRFRINTFLSNKATFPKQFLPKLNSIITQYSNIDTFKKLMPHSGRFTARHKGKSYEVRVSLIPNCDEQSCVLRIHNNNAGCKQLDELGISHKDTAILKDAITRKSGIILITGPTGSGKSTTLYAALSEINKENTSIETIEDPVERSIEGIKQFQVRYSSEEEKNLTFPKLFREVLRHDPDVVMVGEIRDIETAELAIAASQTGHLVLSTLHTQSALGSIPRLISEGLDPQRLADSLILLQAQRLMGILCKNCRIKIDADSREGKSIIKEFEENSIVYNHKSPELYRPGKCEHCNHTGYEGMQAIYELFPVTDEVRECIANRKTVHEIQEFGDRVGYRSLYQEALQKVAQGKTSYQEAKKHKRQYTLNFKQLLKETQIQLQNEI